jgi:hypothetical protein
MFELSDFGKAAPDHKPIRATESVDNAPVFGYGAADEGQNVYERSKFEDGEILSYFKSRRISRKWVQYWMILQVSLLVLQMYLFGEVASHSSVYNRTVKAACNENVAATCRSRLWQRRHTTSFGADQISWDNPLEFKFTAAAWSSYELQIDVLTEPPELHIPFELKVKRIGSSNAPEQAFYEYRTTGISPVLLKQTNHSHVKDLFSGHYFQPSQWEGSINLGHPPMTGHFAYSRHSQYFDRLKEQLKSIRVAVAEMVEGESNLFKKNAPMCDLESTWAKVMLHSMSQGSNRLEWITNLLAISILGSVIVTVLVWMWFNGRRADSIGSLKFHYLVAAKTVVQDIPLQTLVLWYIFSWYEGSGGERCQLCILNIHHCENMSPFHLSNFFILVATLVSAVSNQFLFTTDSTQVKTEDDVGFVIFIRIMLACVMILPFSTAMVAFNGSLVQLPSLMHSIFLLPCFTGWVAFFSLLCFPIATLVDDDDLMTY